MNLNAPLRAQQAQPEPAPHRELVEPPNLDPDFQRLLGQPTNARDLLLNDGTFDRIWRIAESMAQGRHTVPKHLQGNLADCIAVVTQAFEWGMNPYVVAQKTHVVNGTLGYESQLVMAVVQRSGAIVGHFHFEWGKDGNATLCRAGAILRGDNHITWTEWYSSAAVLVKNSPLWKSNVPQQMGYVQGRNWCRLYAPGAILGVYTAEELLDSAPAGATYDDDRGQPSPPPPPPRGPQRKSNAAPTPPAAAEPPPQQGPRDFDPETGEVAPPKASPSTPPQSTEGGGVSAGQIAYLRKKMAAAGITESSVCERYGVAKLEDLTLDAFDEYRAELVAL